MLMTRLRYAIPALLAGCFTNLEGAVSQTEQDPEQVLFFEANIRPVLVLECYECHGAEKRSGDLRLDFRDGLLMGGQSGAAIVPGVAEESLLIQAIRHEHPELEMPRNAPKLDESTIADFVRWVNQGAVDPRDEKPSAADTSERERSWEAVFETRRQWWSFQPVQEPALPQVTSAEWAHPVDRFILAKLTEHGLEPAARANQRTLLRRVSFALTGLPPSVDEMEEFLRDDSPDAYERAVDRLLASPRYGERWARHWLDLFRFAETHGSEGDPEIPEAWRYRDYLIRAFNADVPYDQLIREHIAGDLLDDPRRDELEGINESIGGIAQFRLVEHGFQPVDTLAEQVHVTENQVDVISKAFQGLTVACARCHNHKFDAISQHDYHAIYSILASSHPSQVTIDLPERLRAGRDELEELKAGIHSGLAEAWAVEAGAFSSRLLDSLPGHSPDSPDSPEQSMKRRMAALEERIERIERTARERVIRAGLNDAPAEAGGPIPFAWWTFEQDARDLLGDMHGELLGGAELRGGRLILSGKGAFARTAPLSREVREKTLEAWVALANRQQRGGAVITLETENGAVFDSVVFAEQDEGKWMAGSDYFNRTRPAGGPAESAAAGELIHLAIVYSADNRIALYRNGEPYGSPYTPEGDRSTLRSYPADSARVLFGLRHTGSGGFLEGELAEARLYDRALSSAELAQSFEAGRTGLSAEALANALSPEERAGKKELTEEWQRLDAEFKVRFPDYPLRQEQRARLEAVLAEAAGERSNPFHAWTRLRDLTGLEFQEGWLALVREGQEEWAARRKFNSEALTPMWDLAGGDADQWTLHGINPPETIARAGEFSIEPEGDRILSGLWPAGVYSHRLSQKHNGVLISPRFQVVSDHISIRAFGGKGARVRLITDNYPLGSGGVFPQAQLDGDQPAWVRLNTEYRKGSLAYLEFAPADEVLSRDRRGAGEDGRSYFGAQAVVFHDRSQPPREEFEPILLLLEGDPPGSAEELGRRYGHLLSEAVAAWSTGDLSEPQRVFLDFFIRHDLLPNSMDEPAAVAPLVEQYRRLENILPTPRRMPGVLETAGYDAPFMVRGDHNQLADPVPRGYLTAFGGAPFDTRLSGRLELAEKIADPSNPLTARVAVNRIWHHLFGRGLVATTDNFGRLGETPTHPELLDFLAFRFVESGWSIKEMIRFLATSQTYQMSSEPPALAEGLDPANQWLSHMRVRRLEAEAIRDALLVVSGRLEPAMFGPGEDALGPPARQTRRSIYVTIRRNRLSPFLEVFDGPKPFTTLGRRPTTNVPAQSLTLMNDPFVIGLADHWARELVRGGSEAPERIGHMFETALGRPPDEFELALSREYLEQLARDHGSTGDLPGQLEVWRDFAQSLFNLKEFIYVQ